MKSCIVIPARFNSTRLPGKVLLDIAGKPMIQWVYEKAQLVKNADQVIIATDDEQVSTACKAFGATCIMTSPHHESGTDRIGEVAAVFKECDLFINIQADEPLINPENIELLIQRLLSKPDSNIVTMITEIENEVDLFDFNVVKVVKSLQDRALYFSRSVIPANRDLPFKNWFASSPYYRHIGVYGFKRDTLIKLIELPASTLEKIEKLEQLRWLENGYSVDCIYTDNFNFGVDTEKDLERIRSIMSAPLY